MTLTDLVRCALCVYAVFQFGSTNGNAATSAAPSWPPGIYAEQTALRAPSGCKNLPSLPNGEFLIGNGILYWDREAKDYLVHTGPVPNAVIDTESSELRPLVGKSVDLVLQGKNQKPSNAHSLQFEGVLSVYEFRLSIDRVVIVTLRDECTIEFVEKTFHEKPARLIIRPATKTPS